MMALIPWRNNPNLNDELQSLIGKMELLGSKADDIQFQVRNEELQPHKKRKSEVTLWLKQVDEIKQDFPSIEAEIHSNTVSNSRSALSNKVKRMMEHVDQLLKQGEFSQGLVLDDLKAEGIDIPTTKLEGSTPLTVKDKVRSAFMRGESRVGIFGMGGVGKTTVAMHLNNEISSGCRDCFNRVFYVTVSRGSTVHKLQQDISTALTLTLNSEDEKRRAAELRMSLKKREKSLLILDDIWEDIPMEKVGVAVEGDGCNLLITTRKRDVCRKMSCDTIVEMKPLPENEAWDLFVNKLGNYESLNDATKCVARSVAEECAGLPLAIITTASCMRGECDERVWRYMLRQLQNPSSNQDDMNDKVYNILKLSYDHLSSDKLRQCLLYCALYLEDYKALREKSINHFIEVALLRNEGTRKENIDEGHHMLKALADACLVECTTNSYGRNIVKMHDLIRDMAVKIIGSKGIVKLGKGMKEMPRQEEWTKDLVLVSLMRNDIEGIDDEICPECPNLSVLILRSNPLRKIPHSFFVHMEGLRCLDLSDTKIEELPDSVANLCNLDALFLYRNPFLKAIPSLAGLTKLKYLNLSCTRIKEPPEGVDELINLKSLDITGTMIQSIPKGLLCKLHKLESFLSNYTINIVPEELMSLRKLLSFEGRIDDFDAFKQFVRSDWFDQLERYSICFGDPARYTPQDCRIMDWFESQCVKRITICGHQLSNTINSLDLEDCSFGVECLLEALPSLCGAPKLELCCLTSCSRRKYIISDAVFESGGNEVSTPVKGVRRLKLNQLDNFVCLYVGEAMYPQMFFGRLRGLKISSCKSVKKIRLQNDILPNLESIQVSGCTNLEEISATTTTATTTTIIKWPNLCDLKLESLPKLKRICGNTSFFPQLQHLQVRRCPKLKKLVLLNHSTPSLRQIWIEECREMEEIFEGGDADGAGDDVIQLPDLRRIWLKELPELRSICRKAIVCNSIEEVTIKGEDKLENCPISMPRLLLANTDCRLPTLEAWDKDKDWWNSLFWNDPATKLAFDRLGCLTVNGRIPDTS